MTKHFYYLTNDKLIGLIWRGGAIVERDVFASTDIGMLAFNEYVTKHREVSTYVVTDLIEEDFRLDTVPHLRGNDQDSVVGRKLAQLYRASPFRHGVVQGREPEGRRDDKVLYHAVTNPELLKPLLAALEGAEVPLQGIYSSAVLSGRLLAALNGFFKHTLLVTIVPDFGLRQTYFQNKLIKFSRLTPIIFDAGQPVGELIAAETSRTWQYLDSLRFFAVDETLEVTILVHTRDRQMISDAVRSYPMIQHRFLDIEEVAARLKMKPMPVSSHAEEVLVHVYAQGSIENHFATQEQRRFGIFKRARVGLFALTAGILAVCAAAAGFNLYEASKVSSEIDRRTELTKPLQTEYRTIVNEISKQATTSETVRDASGFFNQYIRPAPASPGDFVRSFSQVLTEFPNIQLLQLVWESVADANATPTYAALTTTAAGSLKSTSKPAGAAGSPAAAATPQNAQSPAESDPPLAEGRFEALIVEAAISSFDGDYRKAISDINVLLTRINRTPGLTATIIVEPLDVRLNAAITATDTAAPAHASARADARFVLKVVRNVKGLRL